VTRRRALALIFGTLIIVYLVSAAFTVRTVRRELIDAVDRDLRSNLDGIVLVIDTVLLDGSVRLDLEDSTRAVIVIDGRDEVKYLPAGPVNEPLPRPELTASMITDRAGRPFEVGSVTGDVEYRVLTARLDDGRYVALAEPLDGLEQVVGTVRWSLLGTLFAVVAVLGFAFLLILRASLRPYDDMIETADAIARGDLDRRATPSANSPDIERLADSLNTMLDRIQESFRARESADARLKQFLADASHELRTPLTTIRGYSELYLSGAAIDSDSVDKQMTRINAEAARMGRLVDDLLLLARLDDAHDKPHESIDLATIVNDAVADATAAGPGHVIVAHVAAGPLRIDGNADLMRQVMSNLLGNALVHTPEGTTVTVRLDRRDRHAVLDVADDGPGMDDANAVHAFDRFFVADHTPASRSTGSGLGLAITAAIIESHCGTIELETRSGHCTKFTVLIPEAL